MVLNKFVPGPGQYKEINVEDVTLKHPPQMVFAKSKRSLSTSNLIPGRKKSIIKLEAMP